MRAIFFAAIIAVLTIPSIATATTQIPDEIILDGELSPLYAEPLRVQILKNPENGGYRPEIPRSLCSASYRGYKAFWRIQNEHLFLDKLVYGPCAKAPQEINLNAYFPGEKQPVTARWYTGVLIVPRGTILNDEHMLDRPTYERYVIMILKNGKVVSRVELDEPPQ